MASTQTRVLKWMRNIFVLLCIVTLALSWIYLNPKEERSAFGIIEGDVSTQTAIALVVSKTGEGADIGKSVEEGVLHYLSALKADETAEQLGLVIYDDKSDPEEARRIAEEIVQNNRFVAVIGHTGNATTLAAAPIYNGAEIPMITPTADAHDITGLHDWTFSSIMPDKEQGAFISFYVQHALGAKRVMLLHYEDDAESDLIQEFKDIAATTGIEVSSTALKRNEGRMSEDESEYLAFTIEEEQPDLVFLSLNADHIADMLVAIKDAGITSKIVAHGPVGASSFALRFQERHKEKRTPGYYTNGVVVPVPFIVDIANSFAQEVNRLYQSHFGYDIHWAFAYGHDAAKAVSEAVQRVQVAAQSGLVLSSDDRVWVLEQLFDMDSADKGVAGISGSVFFNEYGGGEQPPFFAVFGARSLTSGMSQFALDKSSAQDDFEALLLDEEKVEVNGRVYGLSDVVFTGLKFKHIQDIEIEARTFYADFDVWFRYRGNFDPADITFKNAIEDKFSVELVESEQSLGIKYKKIRVKGEFSFSVQPADFLQHELNLGIGFQHKTKGRKELIYAVDKSAYNTNKHNISLLQQLGEDAVVHESEEVDLTAAHMFEGVHVKRAFGDPEFTEGYLPFSQFNTEINLHQKKFSLGRKLGRLLDNKQELAIFFIFSLLTLAISFSFIRAWFGGKVVLVKCLLLAGGLMGAELLFFSKVANYFNFGLTSLDIVVKSIDAIWYLLGAFFAHAVMKYYIWPRLERVTGYPVPSIARTMVSVMIFIICGVLIYAVVFNKSAVSIVAASGALTVVVGFALKELIMDFFSGIVLNIERPFRIGDFVSFHIARGQKVDGFIREMNWRTVRILDDFDNIVVLPNSQISAQHLTNMSIAETVKWRLSVYVDPSVNPDSVIGLLLEALQENPSIIAYDDPQDKPKVKYLGVLNTNGVWAAHYSVKFTLADMGQKNKATEVIWRNIWALFEKNEISLNPM